MSSIQELVPEYTLQGGGFFGLSDRNLNAEEKFGKGNFVQVGIILDHDYEKLCFSKKDVAAAIKAFLHMGKKLHIAEEKANSLSHFKNLMDYFKDKWKKKVDDMHKSFNIPGKTIKTYTSDDWVKWERNHVGAFEVSRAGIKNEIDELLMGFEISEKHKNLVLGIVRYKVGRHVGGFSGD